MAETTSAPSLRELSERATPILYRNWRGEETVRKIVPGGDDPAAPMVWFGSTEWHPEPGFLMAAWDAEKSARRFFAMSGILAWGAEAIAARESTQSEAVASARAEGWQPIETAPKDRTPVMIAVPSLRADQPMIVGEAYFRPREEDGSVWDSDEWWWAGTGPGNYHDSPIHETNAAPTHWRPLPAPPTTPGDRTDG